MNQSTTIRNRCCILLLMASVMLFPAANVRTQTDVEDAIKQLSADNVRGYVQPLMNGFGANMNSGWYHSAEISEMGLHFQFQIVGMGTFIGDGEKTYDAVPPLPYDQTPVQTATLFGGPGSAVTDTSTGLTYHFQNGQVKTSIIPFGTLQATIGNVYGTQAIIRYVPFPERDEFPKVTMWGIGVRHSISRYLPDFPASLAAGFFYQKLSVGDIMDAHAISFGGQISKSYSVFTAYGGLQYETSTLTLSYTNKSTGVPVNVDLNGENHVRATAGVGLKLVILDLNADISIGKVTAASAAISFGM